MMVVPHFLRILLENCPVFCVGLLVELSLGAEFLHALAELFSVFLRDGFVIVLLILLQREHEHVQLLLCFGTEELHLHHLTHIIHESAPFVKREKAEAAPMALLLMFY